MLSNRTFNVVFVRPGKGTGAKPTPAAQIDSYVAWRGEVQCVCVDEFRMHVSTTSLITVTAAWLFCVNRVVKYSGEKVVVKAPTN